MGESTELSTMPGERGDYDRAEAGIAEDGFIERQQSYQQSRGNGSLTSVDFGSDSGGGGGGEFGEGRSKHKINEWQAAWNVTNAIQVSSDPNQINLAELSVVTEQLSCMHYFTQVHTIRAY
jgi:vesicular inhibitory amino acid transporter